MQAKQVEIVATVADIGRLAREKRKSQQATIELLSHYANLSPRFISEFERGKETAEIGKVLKALHSLGLDLAIVPRGWHA